MSILRVLTKLQSNFQRAEEEINLHQPKRPSVYTDLFGAGD